jgi:phage terminase large subunit-like protein
MPRSLRSLTAGGSDKPEDVAKEAYGNFAEKFPQKFYWFVSKGYRPHEWQAAFHSADTKGHLTMYRHLVAGRRGGKTLSAAWETLFYCLHPEVFHRDAHGEDKQRPLWVWVLTKDHEVGMPARQAMSDALAAAGMIPGKDYRWNKTEKKIEFENGTLLQFKSADDPQSLRGAGLDILWVDEAAFIPNDEAWGVVSPALADKIGMLITTTTPRGRNWFWKTFWSDKALVDEFQFRVEYTSIDNPYFKRWMWERERERMHPILFKQEYMAAFNAMTGIELHGDWLHYYSIGDPNKGEVKIPLKEGNFSGRKFIGVDPASSLSDTADHFAMCLIGITDDNSQAFMLDTFRGRIDFPDQLDKIREWFLRYRPEYIGIESNAYQRVLVQQSSRMEGLPPVVPVIAKGKKFERIMSMSPLFKIGKVRIHETQTDFIEEWVNYDSSKKNTDDDLLDAAEIALSAAGVLLPSYIPLVEKTEPQTMQEEAWAQVSSRKNRDRFTDPELGGEA